MTVSLAKSVNPADARNYRGLSNVELAVAIVDARDELDAIADVVERYGYASHVLGDAQNRERARLFWLEMERHARSLSNDDVERLALFDDFYRAS